MTVTRRTFLAGTAAAAGVGTLAACAPAGSGTAASASPGSVIVALADVPVGGAIIATTAGGAEIVVAQPQEGTVVAFSAVCTHQGCIVQLDEATVQLVCPCHDSVFDLVTGENLSGPAPRPLPGVAVTIADGQVVEA